MSRVTSNPSSRRDVWIARSVWGVWAGLTIAAIGFVLRFGVRVPFWDEWGDMVPFYAGVRPIDAGTIWHPQNEHHVPLSRLILIGLARLTDVDLRAGMLLIAVLLAAASALLLRSARAVDGRLRLADCALPLLYLHWGHYVTLLWSYQVHTGLLVLFASALLALLCKGPEPPSPRLAALFGACLVALPLCQAGGIALAPPLAAWFVVAGVRSLRSGEPGLRRAGWMALAAAAGAVALAAFAYVPPRFETAGDPVRVLWWGAVMLSTGLGAFARPSPVTQVLLPVLAAVLLVATLALLLHVLRAQPRERLRALGLGAFLLAFCGLALGIAWGRHEHALSDRYPALAAPLFSGAYLAWRRYGPGRSGAWVCAALCATLVVLTPWNTQAGLAFARKRSETAAAFERDVQGGVPVRRMLNRYVPEVHHASRTLRQGLEYMLEARVGVFRHAGEGQR